MGEAYVPVFRGSGDKFRRQTQASDANNNTSRVGFRRKLKVLSPQVPSLFPVWLQARQQGVRFAGPEVQGSP